MNKIKIGHLFASHEISDKSTPENGQSLAVEIGRIIAANLKFQQNGFFALKS